MTSDVQTAQIDHQSNIKQVWCKSSKSLENEDKFHEDNVAAQKTWIFLIVILHNIESAIIQCSLIQELIKLGNVCFNSQHQRTAISTGAQSVNVNHAKKAPSLNRGPRSPHYLHTYTQIRLCSMSTLHFYRSPASPICLHGTN